MNFDFFRKKRSKSGWLFLSLLVLLFLQPFANTSSLTKLSFTALSTLVLLIGIYSISSSEKVVIISFILAIFPIVLSWLISFEMLTKNTLLWQPGFYRILYFIYIMYHIWKFIFHKGNVNTERLFSAASLYLILGIFWATVYQLIEFMFPNSFNFNAQALNNTAGMNLTFTYYSFTTLTTLGYGDITPASPTCKMLSILESITGVLYIAILIARLASDIEPKNKSTTN